MKRATTIFLMMLIWFSAYTQKEMLQSGPMVGYSEMLEVSLWVQTKDEAKVYIAYWPVNNKKEIHLTNTVTTNKSKAFTALLIADTLEPGNRYNYELFINDIAVALPYATTFQTQPLWKWRTDPPDFSFIMGSGTYINEKKYDRPGKGYGGGYGIFNTMEKTHPDFMIWLGDNIYLREPDWNSKTGIFHRYTDTRSLPEMQAFLASTHNYAILDDHDFGPNDSDRSFWNKNQTLDAFGLFWANPSVGVGDIKGAITAFQWGDADFFMLDNRTYRTPNKRKTGKKTELGEEQLQWLFDNLSNSYATFKFVVMGGQFLSTAQAYESYSNNGFEKERKRIIDFIYKENIKNVVFLTGDVHFSELSVLREDGKPTIWDITSSPLNSGANEHGFKNNNTLRIPESVVLERNFAEIKLTGPVKDRKLHLTYYGGDGEILWEYTIDKEQVK